MFSSATFFAAVLFVVVAIFNVPTFGEQSLAVENEVKDAICKQKPHPFLKQTECLEMAQMIIDGDLNGLKKYLDSLKRRVSRRVANRRRMCMKMVGVRAVCLGFNRWSNIFDEQILLANLEHF